MRGCAYWRALFYIIKDIKFFTKKFGFFEYCYYLCIEK